MEAILSQLGQLLVQTIPTIIFVLLLLGILDRLFFKPLTQKLEEREKGTTGALESARRLSVEAEEKLRRYTEAIGAARLENYHVREAERRKALVEREEAFQRARQQSEVLLREARESLAVQTAQAKEDLRTALETLAAEIAGLALNRPLTAGSREGDNR